MRKELILVVLINIVGLLIGWYVRGTKDSVNINELSKAYIALTLADDTLKENTLSLIDADNQLKLANNELKIANERLQKVCNYR